MTAISSSVEYTSPKNWIRRRPGFHKRSLHVNKNERGPFGRGRFERMQTPTSLAQTFDDFRWGRVDGCMAGSVRQDCALYGPLTSAMDEVEVGGDMLWEGLEARVHADRTIARFSGKTTFRCLLRIGDEEWIIAMTDGMMATPVHGPFVMPQCDFALQGSICAWERFSRRMQAPGDQDIFAFFRRGQIALTGDTRKFYAHLLVLKLILVQMRDPE